jgi:hypothetical protein
MSDWRVASAVSVSMSLILRSDRGSSRGSESGAPPEVRAGTQGAHQPTRFKHAKMLSFTLSSECRIDNKLAVEHLDPRWKGAACWRSCMACGSRTCIVHLFTQSSQGS